MVIASQVVDQAEHFLMRCFFLQIAKNGTNIFGSKKKSVSKSSGSEGELV